MEQAAIFARAGNRVIQKCFLFLAILMLLFGSYCLWDNMRISQGAFVSKDLLAYKPHQDSPLSLVDLQKINADVCGWLTIDDTHIDYPLVIGKTTLEYINKDVYGNFSLSGAIFLDSQNSRDFTDPYTVIYGHHMSNRAMFGDLENFLEKDFFDKHQTGTLSALEKEFRVSIFATMRTVASDEIVYNVTSRDAMKVFEHVKKNAVHYREIGIQPTDQLICLSTCSDTTTNGRILVFGRISLK
ncbi:class B sortase [Granulicatella sp. zg-ZJ]|uniref:class B sortase n=1 Tax=unclassified Granulicatella TaxID=2630493 RepID=UPI0013C0FB61|nr:MULTISPECIES: class B sortase [unclassified Granulicatella]NEW62012.1 class B sortase [Granulicatella sp. zg-ZJ]NEW66763.1 class B sortase [Granulicatella sp. zg-84]QMI85979.1 class B sortase [Carnobacteriaceae bacterium zg-84]